MFPKEAYIRIADELLILHQVKSVGIEGVSFVAFVYFQERKGTSPQIFPA